MVNEMRLKDVTISANTGLDAIKRAPIVEYNTGLKCIRIQDISQGKDYDDWGDTEISEKDYEQFRLKRNDLLVARTGATVGVSYLVKKDYNAVFNNGSIRLRLNKNVNIKFTYYVFQTKSFRQYIDNVSCVATQPNLRIVNLLRFNLPDCDLNLQNKIVCALECYDKALENNNKRMKALEQMAENLYKEWFVRFRFPGYENTEFEDSKMGKIPVGFSVKKMQDVISRYIGGGWGNDEEDKDYVVEAYVIRGTDFPNVKKGNLSSCPYRYHKKSNYKSRELHDLDIVLEVSGGTADQPVGRTLLVTQDVIDRLGGQVICASFCKQIQLKKDEGSPYYYYYWMNYLYDTRIIDRFQLQSTGIINFQFEYFVRKGEILLPPKKLMQRFDQLIVPIYNSISTLSKQNENLIKQRDLLLPRLMSGKLEV